MPECAESSHHALRSSLLGAADVITDLKGLYDLEMLLGVDDWKNDAYV